MIYKPQDVPGSNSAWSCCWCYSCVSWLDKYGRYGMSEPACSWTNYSVISAINQPKGIVNSTCLLLSLQVFNTSRFLTYLRYRQGQANGSESLNYWFNKMIYFEWVANITSYANYSIINTCFCHLFDFFNCWINFYSSPRTYNYIPRSARADSAGNQFPPESLSLAENRGVTFGT